MAKKKNKKSFADLAKEIKNKYTRAHFDPIEARDMEQELNELMNLQELKRQELGLTNQEQMAGGGKMYPGGGSIYQDDRNWLQRQGDNLYGAYEANKPQLFQDFPITDPISYGLQYITGNTPDTGMQTGMPGLVGSPTKTFKPAASTFRKANKKAIQEAQIMDDLVNAPGGLGKQYPTGAKTPNLTKSKASGYQMIDGKMYKVPTSNNIPLENIGYGTLGAGTLAGIGYGASQTSTGTNTPQSYSRPNYGPEDAAAVQQMLNYDPVQDAYSRATSPYLTPQQLAEREQPSPQASSQRQNQSLSGYNTTEQPYDNSLNERWMANEADRVVAGVSNNIQSRGLANREYQTPAQIAATQGLETDKLQARSSGVDNTGSSGDGSFWSDNKQYLPYAISGLSNIASNLLLARMANKNKPRVSPSLATAERINLEPQAEALRKSAGVTKNVGMRNARNLGVNAGQALANMGAVGAQVDRGLGENLTSLYMGQEQANVGAQNRVNLSNQAYTNRANMMNTQLDQQTLENRLGYTAGALGTIPGVMKDIRMDKADAEMRGIMDRYYQSIGGKNYATVGSIWNDPETGFRFRVKADKTLERVK